jgi:hypothetical protein
MFRLIKLAMYALVGYAIYELYQGMSTGHSGGGQRGQGGRGGDLGRALRSAGGRMQTLTGGGEGQEESTFDDSGTSATHRVGRGVTSR